MKFQSPITGIISPPENRFTRSVESVMLTAAFLVVGGYLAVTGKVSWEVFVATLGGYGAVATHAAHTRKNDDGNGNGDSGSGSPS